MHAPNGYDPAAGEGRCPMTWLRNEECACHLPDLVEIHPAPPAPHVPACHEPGPWAAGFGETAAFDGPEEEMRERQRQFPSLEVRPTYYFSYGN